MTVDELLAEHGDDVQQASHWLLGVLRSAMPGAAEKVWTGWHGVGFTDPDAGYVCGVFPREHDVRLFFEHGRRLADPAGVLRPVGTRGAAVDIPAAIPAGRPPAETLAELIDAAVEEGRLRRSA